MQRTKWLLVEVAAGTLLGAAAAFLVAALGTAAIRTPFALTDASLLAFGAVNGATVAFLDYAVRQYCNPVERWLLAVLVGMALASLRVLSGGYGTGSSVPVVIYGISLVNGPLISSVGRFLRFLFETEQDRHIAA